MTGEVVSLLSRRTAEALGILGRLEGVLAILDAIDCAELLAALPECELAQSQHRTALSLLALAQRELHALRDEVL